MCVSVLTEPLSVHHKHSVPSGDQKRVLDPMEPEVQMTVTYRVVLGTESGTLTKEEPVFLTNLAIYLSSSLSTLFQHKSFITAIPD